MLPKFTIREHTEERTVKTVLMTTTRYSAETDWSTPAPDLGPNVTQVLGVDAQGRLTTAFPTWDTRKRAEQAIEKCKVRLR